MSATVEVQPSGKILIKCFNPSDGEPLRELEGHSLEAVNQILKRLRSAAVIYNYTPVRERTKLVRRFRKALVANLDEVIESICSETGKKRPEAMLEVFAALEVMRYQAKIAHRTLRSRHRSSGVLIHKRGYVEYRPHGVAAVISPWNYPFVLVVSPLVEALLAGDTVVVKPSEFTSLTALYLKQLFDESTGRPELFEIVVGAAAVGQQLVSSPLTDIICFTGSTKVGQIIAQGCAQTLKPLVLELGGKDALIILEDANLKRAAKSAVWGGFTQAGQVCMAVERVYVMAAIYDKFLNLLREETRRLTTGDKLEDAIGPITVDFQYDKVSAHLKDAESKGAVVETFGKPDGRHIPPTIITGVDHTMTVMTDETFGPELAVMPVASEEEAIEKANDSLYGLSTYIFTGNERRGRRMARRLSSGMVVINDVIIQYGVAALPFGGFRYSGIGKVHGREGLWSFSQQQAIVHTRIPLPMELWWFDLAHKTYGTLRKFVKWWYG
ncbi:aldehyde dehydrogenase family protein [Candidatus Neomarinimicrobiota bacterium]